MHLCTIFLGKQATPFLEGNDSHNDEAVEKTTNTHYQEWTSGPCAVSLMTQGRRPRATSPRIVPSRGHGLVLAMGDEKLSTTTPNLRTTLEEGNRGPKKDELESKEYHPDPTKKKKDKIKSDRVAVGNPAGGRQVLLLEHNNCKLGSHTPAQAHISKEISHIYFL